MRARFSGLGHLPAAAWLLGRAGLFSLLGGAIIWATAAMAGPPQPSAEFSQKVSAAAAKVYPALATIANSQGYAQSAVIVDGNSGLVASTTRPLRGYRGQTYTVMLQGGGKYQAHYLAVSKTADLAIWRIDSLDLQLPEAALGDSRRLRVGESVIALGSGGHEVRWGIVSAVNRDIAGMTGLIQTDTPLTHQSSGEVLLNLDGEVVGLVTRYPNNALQGARGLGFAVPSRHVAEVRDSLKAHLTRPTLMARQPSPSPPAPPDLRRPPAVPEKKLKPYLGLLVEDYLNIDSDRPPVTGCRIESVISGGPGERAGLKAGDIIVRLADKPTPNVAAYQRILAASITGGTVWLEFFRSGEPLMVQTVMGGLEEEE